MSDTPKTLREYIVNTAINTIPPLIAYYVLRVTIAEAARRELTLGEYAAKWIETRTNSRGEPLRPRTIESYEGYVRPAGVTS